MSQAGPIQPTRGGQPRVLAGHLMLPAEPGRVRLSRGAITLSGGRIAAIDEGRIDPRPDLGGDGFIICPGFVDTHLHLPQFDSIGADGLELLDWLDRVIFPAEARWADADYAGAMAHRVANQLLSFGTTAVAAYATVHHAAAQAAIDALADAGLAGYVGQVLMDQQAPAELIRPASQLLLETPLLKSRNRIQPAITPRFAVSCSAELLHGAGDLARKTGWLVQTHLSETRREIEMVRSLHNAGYVEVYKRAGLMTDRTVFGHGIWLDEHDRRELAAARSVIAHCPTANRFLNAGAMNRAATLASRVHVSLGSDVAGGPDRSMVRVARAMIETAKATGGSAPTAAECWWQITGGNASTIGLHEVGRMERGATADLLLIRPNIEWHAATDPLSALLYAWDDRWLHRVIAAGIEAFCSI